LSPFVNRIAVIGPGGSGKSTLSIKLAKVTGLPLIHLDQLYWKPGWVATPDDEWMALIQERVQEPAWIMDGNYGGTMRVRLEAADTVIFLDFGRFLCIWRLIRRRIRWAGRSRPSVPAGCREELSLEFLHWVWTYPSIRRPRILTLLEDLDPNTRVVTLSAPKEIAAFMATFERQENR
jgi:adenylate kinase family enzyme